MDSVQQKPFTQYCENNKEPIHEVLRHYFSKAGDLLEIGSGTGQHSIYMSEKMPHLTWQASDVAQNLAGINAWGADNSHLSNWLPPIELDVNDEWPCSRYRYVYSANTLHIISWQEVEAFFAGVNKVLMQQGRVCIYGPFKYDGQFTTLSNAEFDVWLKSRNPLSGVRDFEALNKLAESLGWTLLADEAMPANNQCLIWQKA